MTLALTRRTKALILGAAGLILLILLLAATFPIAWLKTSAEEKLTGQFGSPVTIGALDREDRFSFHPIIRLSDLHVRQQPWAGQGEMASIGLLRLRLSILPLLWGRFDSEVLTARHVRLTLVRAADGRENWRKDRERAASGAHPGLSAVSVQDAVVRYTDAKQKRSALLSIRIDPQTGLRIEGAGVIDSAPVRMRVTGSPMVPGRPWPFEAMIDGPAIGIHAAGRMAGPLRTDDMAFRMTARADDLKRIDRVIEAGLFGTQPVNLAADVTHADDTWVVDKLHGTIGQSDILGRIKARRRDGRTKLDGDVHFTRLDFDDLASDRGQAKAMALEKAEGLKLVPNTRINIHKMAHTDGMIAIRVDHVVSGRRPSAITGVSGLLSLDHRVLTISPLRLGLKAGAITGRAVVYQRDGRPHPRVTIALDMTGSRISALADSGNGEVDGRVDARVRLVGTGDTIREAVGTSNGTIGVVARAGALPTRIAALMGFNIGKVLVGDDKGQASLRCAVLRLSMHKGVGTADPLVADTSISRTTGAGTIRFPAEAMAIALTGRPKNDAALRLPGPVHLSGTIRDPRVVVPKASKSIGALFKAIGRAISGDNSPPAGDADCDALIHKALG